MQASADLRGRYPRKRLCATIIKVYGWMGLEEAIHTVCILTTFDLEKLRKEDAMLGSLKLEAPIQCASHGEGDAQDDPTIIDPRSRSRLR